MWTWRWSATERVCGRVRDVLMDVLVSDERVLKDPEPEVGVSIAFSPSP